eukprot:Rmarinus@m.5744
MRVFQTLLLLAPFAAASSGSSRAPLATEIVTFCDLNDTTYDIDWSAASSTIPELSIPDDEELGPCVCDLHPNICDPGCCCDSDCSSTEQGPWTCCCNSDGTEEADDAWKACLDDGDLYTPHFCLVDGPHDDDIVECSDSLEKTNFDDDDFAESAQDHMLCVVRTNKCDPPDCGEFYNDPGNDVSRSQFDERMASVYSYEEDLRGEIYPRTGNSLSYVLGNPVQVSYDIGASSYVTANGGFLSLPYPDHAGLCNNNNFAGFLVNDDLPSCVRYYEDVIDSCTDEWSSLSLTSVTTSVRVAKTPSASPSVAEASAWVSVEVSSLTVDGVSVTDVDAYLVDHTTTVVSSLEDALDGVDLVSPTTTAPTSPAATTATPAVTTAGTTAPLRRSLLAETNTTQYCARAVNRVKYTVVYSSSSVTAVYADVALITVTPNDDGSGSLAQQFSVDYVSIDDFSRGVEVKPRSGNPGYITGAPVLAGYIQQSGDLYAIAQLTEGLEILGPSFDGTCSSSSSRDVQVGMSHNSIIDCTVPITRTALQEYCMEMEAVTSITSCECGSSASAFLGVAGCRLKDMYLGVWGNAVAENVEEWVPLSLVQDAELDVTWNSATSTCEKVPTAINIEIITADLGSQANPQRRIVAARFMVNTNDWRVESLSSTAVEYVAVRQTVTFVNLPSEGLDYYVPPPPSSLPTVPDDFFYPFTD